METLFSLGIVLILIYVTLILFKWLKKFILNIKHSTVDAAVSAQKENAMTELSKWVTQEKEKQATKLDQEYNTKIEQIRNKVSKETEKINEHHEAYISELRTKEEKLSEVIYNLEAEISEQRNLDIKELEIEIAEKRSAAVADIETWSSDEKKRLSTQFAKDYKGEVGKLKQELDSRMDTELENIKKLFTDFSAEEIKLAKKDIKNFIMTKLTLKT